MPTTGLADIVFTTALSSASDSDLSDTRSLNIPPAAGPPTMVALLSARNLVISAALACGLKRTETYEAGSFGGDDAATKPTPPSLTNTPARMPACRTIARAAAVAP